MLLAEILLRASAKKAGKDQLALRVRFLYPNASHTAFDEKTGFPVALWDLRLEPEGESRLMWALASPESFGFNDTVGRSSDLGMRKLQMR